MVNIADVRAIVEGVQDSATLDAIFAQLDAPGARFPQVWRASNSDVCCVVVLAGGQIASNCSRVSQGEYRTAQGVQCAEEAYAFFGLPVSRYNFARDRATEIRLDPGRAAREAEERRRNAGSPVIRNLRHD